MTRVYKLEVLVIDHDDIGPEEAKDVLENTHYPNRCISPHVMDVKVREVVWDDDHPLNRADTWRKAYEELFAEPEG